MDGFSLLLFPLSMGLLSSLCLLFVTSETDAALLRPNIKWSRVKGAEVKMGMQSTHTDTHTYVYIYLHMVAEIFSFLSLKFFCFIVFFFNSSSISCIFLCVYITTAFHCEILGHLTTLKLNLEPRKKQSEAKRKRKN